MRSTKAGEGQDAEAPEGMIVLGASLILPWVGAIGSLQRRGLCSAAITLWVVSL